jgi:hypothetical protein
MDIENFIIILLFIFFSILIISILFSISYKNSFIKEKFTNNNCNNFTMHKNSYCYPGVKGILMEKNKLNEKCKSKDKCKGYIVYNKGDNINKGYLCRDNWSGTLNNYDKTDTYECEMNCKCPEGFEQVEDTCDPKTGIAICKAPVDLENLNNTIDNLKNKINKLENPVSYLNDNNINKQILFSINSTIDNTDQNIYSRMKYYYNDNIISNIDKRNYYPVVWGADNNLNGIKYVDLNEKHSHSTLLYDKTKRNKMYNEIIDKFNNNIDLIKPINIDLNNLKTFKNKDNSKYLKYLDINVNMSTHYYYYRWYIQLLTKYRIEFISDNNINWSYKIINNDNYNKLISGEYIINLNLSNLDYRVRNPNSKVIDDFIVYKLRSKIDNSNNLKWDFQKYESNNSDPTFLYTSNEFKNIYPNNTNIVIDSCVGLRLKDKKFYIKPLIPHYSLFASTRSTSYQYRINIKTSSVN